MSTFEVAAVVVLVVAVVATFQAVVVLFRRHSLDARRPGPLIERLRRREHSDVPPRLETLKLQVADAITGPPQGARAMQESLSGLAAEAPHPVSIAGPGEARRRARWLSDQLATLEAAYGMEPRSDASRQRGHGSP